MLYGGQIVHKQAAPLKQLRLAGTGIDISFENTNPRGDSIFDPKMWFNPITPVFDSKYRPRPDLNTAATPAMEFLADYIYPSQLMIQNPSGVKN